MRNLKEELLQFIWQHKLLKPLPLVTVSGKEITLLKPGELNSDSGPDFFNAQILIDGIKLAGNIEVHIKTSDWLKHNHQHDKNYDNLILHVVYHHDSELKQNSNNNVEVLELKNLLDEKLSEKYDTLMENKHTLACRNQLQHVNDLKFTSWLQRMYAERLERKTKTLEELFEAFESNYSQTFYTLLLRNFGFKVNAIPFEMLAKKLPLTILLKHSDNILQLEALLLGVSGLLDDQFSDKYVRSLQNEFEYLKNKYQLVPLQKEIFKFSKLRPANFATLRLAQFAKLVHSHPNLFSGPQYFDSFEKIDACFQFDLEGYWKNHYNLNGTQTEKKLSFGADSIHNVIINTFSVFFFFYYKQTSVPQFENTAFILLEACPFEMNTKTKHFLSKKEFLKSAVESQGLINLLDNYCTQRKCLSCAVAADILKSP